MNEEQKRQLFEYVKSGKEFYYKPSKKRPNTFIIIGCLLALIVILVTTIPNGVGRHPLLFISLFILSLIFLGMGVIAAFKMAKGYKFTKDSLWIFSGKEKIQLPFKQIASITLPGWFIRLASGGLVSHVKVWLKEGSIYQSYLLNDIHDFRVISRLILDKAAEAQGVEWTKLVGNPYYREDLRNKKGK